MLISSHTYGHLVVFTKKSELYYVKKKASSINDDGIARCLHGE